MAELCFSFRARVQDPAPPGNRGVKIRGPSGTGAREAHAARIHGALRRSSVPPHFVLDRTGRNAKVD